MQFSKPINFSQVVTPNDFLQWDNIYNSSLFLIIYNLSSF